MPQHPLESFPASNTLLKRLITQTLLDLQRLGEVYDWDTVLMRTLRAMTQRQTKCLELVEPLISSQK